MRLTMKQLKGLIRESVEEAMDTSESMAKQVFLVDMGRDLSSGRVAGVYSTREAAEAALKIIEENRSRGRIRVVSLDPSDAELEKKIEDMQYAGG